MEIKGKQPKYKLVCGQITFRRLQYEKDFDRSGQSKFGDCGRVKRALTWKFKDQGLSSNFLIKVGKFLSRLFPCH